MSLPHGPGVELAFGAVGGGLLVFLYKAMAALLRRPKEPEAP